jgi:[ribosomal protein S5]-alanine N-acetyltransferase
MFAGFCRFERPPVNLALCVGSKMYQEIRKCIIRNWQIQDAPSLAKYANNRKIWLNLRDAFPYPYSLGDAEVFISRVTEADPVTIFAIESHSEAIGSIGLLLGNDIHLFTAEMGYWLAEPYWGKGIMTDAVQFLTTWAFDELRLHRISAEPYANNTASHRVLEKAGFIREGVLRSSAFKDGKIIDQYLYSKIGNIGTHPINSADPKDQAAD